MGKDGTSEASDGEVYYKVVGDGSGLLLCKRHALV